MRPRKESACHAAHCTTITCDIARSRTLTPWTQPPLANSFALSSWDCALVDLAPGESCYRGRWQFAGKCCSDGQVLWRVVGWVPHHITCSSSLGPVLPAVRSGVPHHITCSSSLGPVLPAVRSGVPHHITCSSSLGPVLPAVRSGVPHHITCSSSLGPVLPAVRSGVPHHIMCSSSLGSVLPAVRSGVPHHITCSSSLGPVLPAVRSGVPHHITCSSSLGPVLPAVRSGVPHHITCSSSLGSVVPTVVIFMWCLSFWLLACSLKVSCLRFSIGIMSYECWGYVFQSKLQADGTFCVWEWTPGNCDVRCFRMNSW